MTERPSPRTTLMKQAAEPSRLNPSGSLREALTATTAACLGDLRAGRRPQKRSPWRCPYTKSLTRPIESDSALWLPANLFCTRARLPVQVAFCPTDLHRFLYGDNLEIDLL